MPDLPRLIEVARNGSVCTVRIDGEDFPWHISVEGVSTSIRRDEAPAITLTIPADEVRVTDALSRRGVSSVAEWQRGASPHVDAR